MNDSNQGEEVFSQEVKIGNKSYNLTSDDNYLRNIGDEFEPEVCNMFRLLVKPDFRVIDVGANIGCTTLLFGEISEYVESFEPSPSTFKFLSLNINKSKSNNIRLHNFGLGDKNENLTLTFSPLQRSGAFVSNLTQASSGHLIEKIEIKIGDDIFFGKKIDFIKIDVEGFEKNVINGFSKSIQNNLPIVVLELNHWCLNAFQRISIPDFFDFLLQIFPHLYAIDGKSCVNLRDPSARYSVMFQHINSFKYPNLVGAFNENQIMELISSK